MTAQQTSTPLGPTDPRFTSRWTACFVANVMGLLAGLLVDGCGDTESAALAGPDAGPRDVAKPGAEPDAASPEAKPALDDVEVWVPPDAGQRDNPDPSLSPTEPNERKCAPLLRALGTDSGPACSAETGACVVGCAQEPEDAQEGCRDACAGMDGFGGEIDCGGCLTLRLLGCFDERGCSTDALFCCIDDRCGVGGPDGCVDAMCQAELQDLFGCVTGNGSALGCFDYQTGPVSSCFATADAGI